ncbi:MAG: SCO family protein [Comamonas sp.]|uniref:SCO family protein n=1 Tax=Comamonas sp. TaxID=34028 RepID=UPI002FC82361
MHKNACRRRSVLLWGALSATVALVGCTDKKVTSFHGLNITGSTYGQDFHLMDPEGRERTLADFRGQAVMIFFGFTQCPDVCPTPLSRAIEVKQLLGQDADRLQVIFVTINPERDTPQVLKEYTAAFDPSFLGLYGNLERTAATAKDFQVFYKKVPTGSSYTMDHSALTYIYDPAGKLRLAMRHQQTAQEFSEDIRQLLHPA